jgi:methyltransferase-like protein 23
MVLSLNLQTIIIGSIKMQLYVPDPESVKQSYALEKVRGPEAPFPYWTKIWPSAIAMAEYLQKNQGLLKGKNVLELAAGLGLPSLVAARYAVQVCCSDYLEEAITVVRKTVLHNRIINIDCAIYNWNCLPEELTADVLLLSDVNYEPEVFDQLIKVCEKFLQQGTRIILTTPGRIMAKDFVSRLDEWCVKKAEIPVNADTTVYLYELEVLSA